MRKGHSGEHVIVRVVDGRPVLSHASPKHIGHFETLDVMIPDFFMSKGSHRLRAVSPPLRDFNADKSKVCAP